MSQHEPSPIDLEAPVSSDHGLFGLGGSAEHADLVVIAVPFDATASYRRGAAAGPAAILQASCQLDFFDPLTPKLSRFPEHATVAITPDDPVYLAQNAEACALVDAVRAAEANGGDASWCDTLRGRINAIGNEVNTRLGQTIAHHLGAGQAVAVLGGDHSVALANLTAHAARVKDHGVLGVLHLDAHADLRDAYEGLTYSHASVMHNALAAADNLRLVQVGLRDLCASEFKRTQTDRRVRAFLGPMLQQERFDGRTWTEQINDIVGALPDLVYVSFDIDALDPAYCPHTGTPVPGGLSYEEAIALIRAVVRSGRRIVGFDLNEVAPGPGQSYDADIGARVLFQLCRHTLVAQ